MKSAKRFLRMSLAWAVLMAILFFLPALWDRGGEGGLWTGRVIALAVEVFLSALLNATFPRVDAIAPHLPEAALHAACETYIRRFSAAEEAGF